MTTYSQTIVNPGAESGTTGWTGGSSTTADHNTGTRCFTLSGPTAQDLLQTLSVDAARYGAVDHGQVTAELKAYHKCNNVAATAYGELKIFFYSSEDYLLGSGVNSETSPTAWTQETISVAVPAGTRTIVFGTGNRFTGAGPSSRWDDFTLDLIDSETPNLATNANATQIVPYAVASQTADEARASQIVPLTVSAAETSNGFYNVNVHQVVAYALVKGKVDRVDLRAWTFLQDDHLFYGLQLGSAGTIVYDILTQQWCQWYSPGFTYFRAEDVTDWEGYNLAADTENGTIWKIDPTGRLDEGDTVITSQVTGQATVRGRRTIPCYTAELACSQANPAGVGTSIQLRTSDDGTASWVDHGTVAGEAIGTSTLFRWYGLGTMVSPGRVFELTNAGYARRLDGLDLELGGSAGDVTSGQ